MKKCDEIKSQIADFVRKKGFKLIDITDDSQHPGHKIFMYAYYNPGYTRFNLSYSPVVGYYISILRKDTNLTSDELMDLARLCRLYTSLDAELEKEKDQQKIIDTQIADEIKAFIEANGIENYTFDPDLDGFTFYKEEGPVKTSVSIHRVDNQYSIYDIDIYYEVFEPFIRSVLELVDNLNEVIKA